MEDEAHATGAKEENQQQQQQQVLKVLEALKQASHELQSNRGHNSAESNSSAIKALLELETEADTILSTYPYLSSLSHHLTTLKTLIDTATACGGGRLGLRSYLNRRVSSHEIARVAGSIESEIQAWIDRETIENLTRTLTAKTSSVSEDGLIDLMEQFRNRVAQGFDRELQDLILKSKVFGELEIILCGEHFSKNVREGAAVTILELIRFNKDVFVGQVLMGQTIRALISLSTFCSLKVLCSLIQTIKSPLVDEIESNGEIDEIISFLSHEDLAVKRMTMDCILEMGYFGRKEAVEAMLKEGLIKRLVELQRSELGGDLIEVGRRENVDGRFLEKHPFASCVARFAVQLEVGEGLRQREKRAFKQEILVKVREASVSSAEAATIIAEVLWGSSP